MSSTEGVTGARSRDRRAWLTQWVSDLRLGVRLAIGGGRTSKTGIARLVLGTIGIGLAVGVLLVGASVGPMFDARAERQGAQLEFEGIDPRPGVDALYTQRYNVRFHDLDIAGAYVNPSGPRAPLPPGVRRLPGDGEILLSSALAELLSEPDGQLLRPRFPQRVIGTIGDEGVTDAGTLTFYAGDSSLNRDNAGSVYGYGTSYSEEMPPNLVVLIVIGTVVLLVPVFVFVATSARIAGAERDRRLAALRLVGADSRQARRIAAAESLASALTGLAFGIGLFLLFRASVGEFAILGLRPYPADVAPPWPLVMLIILLVPGLAVLTAQVALRRTIIEPLGVVRRSRPVRRRLWWRLVPLGLGAVLLFLAAGNGEFREGGVPVVVAGSALLLLGIPAVLPWLLERAVARVRGGRPASQLAIRRLQMDSGTPARVVGGVAVVLAGAIALEAVLAAQTRQYDPASFTSVDEQLPPIVMRAQGDVADAVAGAVRAVPGVESLVLTRYTQVQTGNGSYSMPIVDCAVLLRYSNVGRCTDGDVFRTGYAADELTPGRTVRMVGYTPYRGEERFGSEWTIPTYVGYIELSSRLLGVSGGIVATPGAVRGLTMPEVNAYLGVTPDGSRPDVVEDIRNAVASYGWRVSADAGNQTFRSTTMELFLTIRNGLLGGALFTLLLAGVSMLVLALEQIRERRRPLAALAATGVPTRTLARSLLWQNGVPVLLAVLVAVVTGIGLAALVFRLLDEPLIMNWGAVALFSGIAALLVLVVTALTLPTLRSATRLAALRNE